MHPGSRMVLIRLRSIELMLTDADVLMMCECEYCECEPTNDQRPASYILHPTRYIYILESRILNPIPVDPTKS